MVPDSLYAGRLNLWQESARTSPSHILLLPTHKQEGRREKNSRDEPDVTIPGSLGILNIVWNISRVSLRSQSLLKSLETHILVADLWSSES